MPTKNKSKKTETTGKTGAETSSVVADGLSTEEMSKDQLEEHIVRLREELDREREERSYFQLERGKIQALWEISKRSLEEAKGELRNRQRKREEAEERHQADIAVYKQKLQHILSEHHNTTSELKMDGMVATSLLENQHMESEFRLRREKHSLQTDLGEKKLHTQRCIQELELKHQVDLMELADSYNKRIREMKLKDHNKMMSMIEVENKKWEADLKETDGKIKSRIVTLKEDHNKARRHAEKHYSCLEKDLELRQEKLKEEFTAAKRQQAQVNRQFSAAQQENTRLHESLREAENKLPVLQKQLEEHNQAKARMMASRARVKVIEKETKDLKMKHMLLEQACEKVEQERDELLKKQTKAILDIEQKCGLKEMLLERKLAAVAETLEKKEAQLCALLAATSNDQTAASSAANRLEEIMESKRVTIDALQCDLARGCKEYDQLLLTCKEKLKARGVPLHDFSFKTSKQILGEQAQAQNSAGPASKH